MADQRWQLFKINYAISSSYNVIGPFRRQHRKKFSTFHMPSSFLCQSVNALEVMLSWFFKIFILFLPFKGKIYLCPHSFFGVQFGRLYEILEKSETAAV